MSGINSRRNLQILYFSEKNKKIKKIKKCHKMPKKSGPGSLFIHIIHVLLTNSPLEVIWTYCTP